MTHPDDLPAYVEHLEAELAEARSLLLAAKFATRRERPVLSGKIDAFLGTADAPCDEGAAERLADLRLAVADVMPVAGVDFVMVAEEDSVSVLGLAGDFKVSYHARPFYRLADLHASRVVDPDAPVTFNVTGHTFPVGNEYGCVVRTERPVAPVPSAP